MVPIIHRPGLPVPLPLLRGGLGATTAAGGRATLGLESAALEDYEEGSFTVTGVGFSGTAPSDTAFYARVGKLVSITFPYLPGTSNATTFTITGLPSALAPLGVFRSPAVVQDNGVLTLGLFQLNGGTVIELFSSMTFVGWTASGAKAVWGPSCTYLIV